MTPPSPTMKRSFTFSPCVGMPISAPAPVGSPGVKTRWSGWSRSGESSGHRFGRPGVAAWLFIRPRSSQPGNRSATPCPLGLLTCPEDPPPRDRTFRFGRGGESGCEDRFRANGHGSRRIGLLFLAFRSERERERETERRPARWAGQACLNTRTPHAAEVLTSRSTRASHAVVEQIEVVG